MILSDITIEEFIDSGKITVLPAFKKSDIRPTGIRLYLNKEILIPAEGQTIDLSEPTDVKYVREIIPKDGYLLRPNMFILCSTIESIMTPRNIVCHIEGRSTIARLGLSIHCTSGIFDNNHDEPRSIVLEIRNNGVFNMLIKGGMPIGMCLFSELTHPIRRQSQLQYKNQNFTQPPNLRFKIEE